MGRLMAGTAFMALACIWTACAGTFGEWPSQVSSVQSVVDQPIDDQKVVMRGHIREKVKHEKYLFSDGTGQVLLDIDDDDWPHGRVPPPDQLVEIYGEVDVDDGEELEIEVKRIALVTPS